MDNYKVVDKQGNEVYGYEPTHPGEFLADEIEAMRITQKEFAAQLNMKPSHLNELLRGKRNITAPIALKLEDVLGISASFWMRAQGEYYLAIARLERKEFNELSQEAD